MTINELIKFLQTYDRLLPIDDVDVIFELEDIYGFTIKRIKDEEE